VPGDRLANQLLVVAESADADTEADVGATINIGRVKEIHA
jgi:hypothetical protein